MPTIQKVVITEFGDESKLRIVESAIAEPGTGEVQIAVEYSVVAGSDINMRKGRYPFQRKAPLTPGYSVVGTVRAHGPGAGKFALRARVACLTKYDGQAELTNQPEKYLVSVPEGVDLRMAVALILDWMTAYEMLHRSAKVKAGQRIFVHGLSGGVGRALLALGRLADVAVFGTASASKHDELRRAGAFPFPYKDKEWISAMEARGGAHAVFDPLGFESFDESYRIVARGGILVGYGGNLATFGATRPRSPFPGMLKLLARNLQVWSGKRTTFFGLLRSSKHYNPDLANLFALLRDGKIRVPIKGEFPMRDVQAAHREYANGSGTGSIILAVHP